MKINRLRWVKQNSSTASNTQTHTHTYVHVLLTHAHCSPVHLLTTQIYTATSKSKIDRDNYCTLRMGTVSTKMYYMLEVLGAAYRLDSY